MQNTTTAGQTAIHNMRKAESLNELKQLYRVYAMQFHPDHGGDEETMKAINATFTTMFEILKNHQNTRAEQEHARGNWKGFSTTTETPEEFIDIVNKLHAIGGIVIELCGSWIWISGETKDNREALRAAKCRWSKNKQQWYWRHEEDFCIIGGRSYVYDILLRFELVLSGRSGRRLQDEARCGASGNGRSEAKRLQAF